MIRRPLTSLALMGLALLTAPALATTSAWAAEPAAVTAADRTLGGLCDWIETDAPEPADLAVEGAPTIRAAVLILTLHYTSNDPLG